MQASLCRCCSDQSIVVQYLISLPPSWFHCVHDGATPGFVGLELNLSVTSHTKYPSLRSSGVTAALLTPSLGLRPPPRLEAEWTVLKSREEGVLEGRAPDEALDDSGCPLGTMTVLMTGGA